MKLKIQKLINQKKENEKAKIVDDSPNSSRMSNIVTAATREVKTASTKKRKSNYCHGPPPTKIQLLKYHNRLRQASQDTEDVENPLQDTPVNDAPAYQIDNENDDVGYMVVNIINPKFVKNEKPTDRGGAPI